MGLFEILFQLEQRVGAVVVGADPCVGHPDPVDDVVDDDARDEAALGVVGAEVNVDIGGGLLG